MSHAFTIYDAENARVLSFVPSTAMRILDIGCGTGVLGARLRQQKERFVAGITYSEEEAKIAAERLSSVIRADLNNFDLQPLGKFDCVIMSHILEHLYAPSQVLEKLKEVLEPGAVIIVALPNVLWWKQRMHFLFGDWSYTDSGILDRTHFRFFNRRSSRRLLEEAGYEVVREGFDGPFPLLKPIRGMLGEWAGKIDRLTSGWTPGLLAQQFVYLAKVRSTVDSGVAGSR